VQPNVRHDIPTTRKRNLFSASSLSPAPGDNSDNAQSSDADDSQSEYPTLRRSSRVVAPPKPITTHVPTANRSRRKQTEFDRLFLEDTRRKRARGGVDGYKKAESLAATLESSSANEADDSNDDQDAWSTTESARQPGQLNGARSRSSCASSFMSGSDDDGLEAKAHAGDDEPHVGGLAQKYLGRDDTKKLKSILQDDASSLRSRILEDGAQTLGEKRTLWEKSNINTYVGIVVLFVRHSLTLGCRRRPRSISTLVMCSSRDCLQQYKTRVCGVFSLVDAETERGAFSVI
jgi:hypothetical protein